MRDFLSCKVDASHPDTTSDRAFVKELQLLHNVKPYSRRNTITHVPPLSKVGESFKIHTSRSVDSYASRKS